MRSSSPHPTRSSPIGPILAVPGLLPEIVAARSRGVPAVGSLRHRRRQGPARPGRQDDGRARRGSTALGVARRYAALELLDASSSTARTKRSRTGQGSGTGRRGRRHDHDGRAVAGATRPRDARRGGRTACRTRPAGSRAGGAAVTAADLSRIVALVPVRSLSGAKSRLGEPLDPEERADLILALLRRYDRSRPGGQAPAAGPGRLDGPRPPGAGTSHGCGLAPPGDRRAQRRPGGGPSGRRRRSHGRGRAAGGPARRHRLGDRRPGERRGGGAREKPRINRLSSWSPTDTAAAPTPY